MLYCLISLRGVLQMNNIAFNMIIRFKQSREVTRYFNSNIKLSNGIYILPVKANIKEQLYIPVRAKILSYTSQDQLPYEVVG